VIPDGVQLWPIGTDTAKGEIYGRLKLSAPGPRFVHFHAGLTVDFYEQLTAERLVTRYTRGVPRLEWDLPSGRRNEVLDCFVYAYAAAIRVGLLRMDWDAVEGIKPSARPTSPRETAPPARQQWIAPRRNWLG
jgi:terminase, large subunit